MASRFCVVPLLFVLLVASSGSYDIEENTPPEADFHGVSHTDALAQVGGSSRPPLFETKAHRAKRQAAWNKYYSIVNSHAVNRKQFKETQAKQKKLNDAAEKARLRYVRNHERLQKKYANDDAEDAGNSANDAFAHNGPIGTGTGSYQSANGVNTWYTDGVVSKDARTTRDGHYLLGPSRRRIGAGFGRRRRTRSYSSASGYASTSAKTIAALKKGIVTKHMIKAAVKGHGLLKAGLVKHSISGSFTAAEKKVLLKTHAGLHPKVDKSGRFVTKINHNILGKNSNMLPKVVAKTVPKTSSDEFVEPTPIVEPTAAPVTQFYQGYDESDDEYALEEDQSEADEPNPYGP